MPTDAGIPRRFPRVTGGVHSLVTKYSFVTSIAEQEIDLSQRTQTVSDDLGKYCHAMYFKGSILTSP